MAFEGEPLTWHILALGQRRFQNMLLKTRVRGQLVGQAERPWTTGSLIEIGPDRAEHFEDGVTM